MVEVGTWLSTPPRSREEILLEYDRLKEIIDGLYEALPPWPDHFNFLCHYTDISDLEILCALVELVRGTEFPVPLKYLEVGSWAGSSAMMVASRPNVEIHCVDHWQGSQGLEGESHRDTISKEGDVFPIFKKNVAGTGIIAHRGHSLELANAWPGPRLDIIFLDGDHRWPEVKYDIEAWAPHVRSGGILCGHDFKMQSVTAAARELGHDASVGDIWYKRM